ncbi:hypothetical protein ATANTOWER_016797 [Ataeniobius toweri]|uniref:Uncharacterized protein n=1 Tax=Ataeniobius toweri TaxID=208326 RepID=A0ABU7CK50_9TELE|nr:hypothetical protein [Ataeniobius toweri]
MAYFFKSSKKPWKKSPKSNISTITGSNRRNNTDNASEEVNYADLKFPKKKKGKKDQMKFENTSTTYAQIRVDNRPAVSSPPAQGQNYAEISFASNRNGGARNVEFSISSDVQTRVNANGPPAPPPKTYKGNNEQMRMPAPQPYANMEQLYAEVNKSQRR